MKNINKNFNFYEQNLAKKVFPESKFKLIFKNKFKPTTNTLILLEPFAVFSFYLALRLLPNQKLLIILNALQDLQCACHSLANTEAIASVRSIYYETLLILFFCKN